jgi:two-component system, NtrC family, nitrogen regulation response regulator GlnG
MADHHRGRQDTTQLDSLLGAERAEVRMLGLTILYHPDLARVGERALLPELAAGRGEPLARSTPRFAAPGGIGGAGLAEPHLSRTPLWLVPGSTPDSLRLELRDSRTPVEANGSLLAGSRELSPAEVEAGVVLLLGGYVVVLLHLLHPLAAPASPAAPADGLVGESPALLRVRQEIRKLADLPVPVLLLGETGTGKELVARALHEAGRRAAGPYVAVNLAAVPSTMAAAELFGAVRGAFTGADRTRSGYFARAHGGTLFLDEVGEMPAEVQPMLLRALETGEVQSVGAERPQRVDVRLVSATDADLETAVREGQFSAPLLYRLGGYILRLPPLRERREDLGRLLVHFLREELAALGESHRLAPSRRPWLPARLVARLCCEPWPGNVRQLRNVVRQLVVAHRGSAEVPSGVVIEPLLGSAPGPRGTGGSPIPPPPVPVPTAPRRPAEIRESELVAALRANRWRLQATADQLGIPRSSLYELIDRSASIRKATDLEREEIAACGERCGGNVEAMAEALEVSERALRRRLGQLGLGPESFRSRAGE